MAKDHIIIENVRVSFPHLFTRPIINGEEGKCGCVLMLDPKKHAAEIDQLEASIEELTKERFKGRKIPSDKVALRDGEDKGRPEYEGYMVLSANAKDRPAVVGKNGKEIDSEDQNEIYAGCYVNAKVQLWAQDNNFGKRINGQLIAIQFAADGEPLDGTYVSKEEAMSGFKAVEEDDDDFLAA